MNSDINATHDNVDLIYMDATKEFCFEDDTFHFIFSEHMIEHVSYKDGSIMLSECFRVLKPNGKIRVATPDLSFLISLYSNDKSEIEKRYIRWSISKFTLEVPAEYDTFVINNFVRDWGHLFIYDQKTLWLSFETAGFRDIACRQLNESEDDELKGLENTARMPDGFLALETIILEAKK